MRILMSCTPAYGHFHPLVPFALAAVARGHTVAFATSEDLIDRVRTAGFEGLQTGLPLHEHKRLLESELAEYAQLPPDEGRAFIFPRVNALRARTNLQHLLQAAERWAPDLIVHETAEFAAPVVAAILRVPNVNHAYGPRVPGSILQDCGNRLVDLWHRVCAAPIRFGGLYRYLHIDICPPAFQVDRLLPPCRLHAIRPGSFDAVPGEHAPEWITELPPGPTAYVTLGTRLIQTRLLRLVVESLLDLNVNVICTTGADLEVTDELPRSGRLHVEQYIPQSAALPNCDLVVCHAGSGTMLGALGHGLPMLLLPQSADQFDNAERCVALGVGVRLLPGEVTADAIAGAARQLLCDHRYARAATETRHHLRVLPGPETAVERCESLLQPSFANA